VEWTRSSALLLRGEWRVAVVRDGFRIVGGSGSPPVSIRPANAWALPYAINMCGPVSHSCDHISSNFNV
jgi:hypothetical protein